MPLNGLDPLSASRTEDKLVVFLTGAWQSKYNAHPTQLSFRGGSPTTANHQKYL